MGCGPSKVDEQFQKEMEAYRVEIEELEELEEHLDAEDDGFALGLDALDRRAPAAGLLLHIYTANSCAPCRRLTCHSIPPESICQ